MTTEPYPKLMQVDIEDFAIILREMIRLRDEDITGFTNLDRKFLPGRSTDRVPSAFDDVENTDQEGDVVNDGTFEYKLINTGSTLEWDRRTLDVGW